MSNCKMCFHEDVCQSWIRHGLTFCEGYDYSTEDCPNFISREDVAPIRRGEWIVCGDGDSVPWMCSRCGKTITNKHKMTYGDYCPNCGSANRKIKKQTLEGKAYSRFGVMRQI